MRFRSALVAGATGFIGSALVCRLAAAGVSTHCLVRPGSSRVRLQAISGVNFLEAQTFDSPTLKRLLRGLDCEVVFNLASYGVHQGNRDPELMLQGNVMLVSALLQAAIHLPLSNFVHAGSCSEYGMIPPGLPASERTSLEPLSVYGAAKAAATLWGAALAKSLGIKFVALRLFGTYGPGEAPDRLIPYMKSNLEKNTPVDLTPGEQIRDLLYVEDVCEAFIAAASSELVSGTAYNVCSGIPRRVRDIGETVADLMGKPRTLLQWGKRDYRADEPMWLVGDNSRLRASTGWQPKVGLEDGLKKMIASGSFG